MNPPAVVYTMLSERQALCDIERMMILQIITQLFGPIYVEFHTIKEN